MKVVCLAGGIASGKTTLAEALETAVDKCVRRAFGDVVRRHAAATGGIVDRRALQETGERLIERGWSSFVAETIGDVDEGVTRLLVVEGIRHIAAVHEVRRQMKHHDTLLVFMHVSDDVTGRRIDERLERHEETAHRVESEIPLVRSMADVLVDDTDPVDEVVTTILDRLGIDEELGS